MDKKKKLIILVVVLMLALLACGIGLGAKYKAKKAEADKTKSANQAEYLTDEDGNPVLDDDGNPIEVSDAVDDGQAEDAGSANSEKEYTQSDAVVLADDPTTKSYDNGIVFEEEEEGAEIKIKKSEASKFYGSWKSTSGQSEYFYGGIDITINSDNTWKGTITDEAFNGAWVEKDGGIYLSSNVFDCSLKFTDSGKMIMQQDYGDPSIDPVVVVLSKK